MQKYQHFLPTAGGIRSTHVMERHGGNDEIHCISSRLIALHETIEELLRGSPECPPCPASPRG